MNRPTLFRLFFIVTGVIWLAACGGDATPTPLPSPLADLPLVLAPTNTPVPPPPTPTLRPSATPQIDATALPAAHLTSPMIALGGGIFIMGSDAGNPDSGPAHQLAVGAFAIDTFEVTNADFESFVDVTGYETEAEKSGSADNWHAYASGKANHPVVKVSWNDAAAFCEWAGKRLPTEVEWEFAARGTDGYTFPWGNEFDPQKANVKLSGLRGTAVVGSFPSGANSLGIQDLAGNVAEWTATVPEPYPGNATDSKLYGANLYIVRGGGWFSPQEQVTTFYRNSNVPIAANDDLGFRCAK